MFEVSTPYGGQVMTRSEVRVLPRPPTADVCYTSSMKTNSLILVGFGLVLVFMEGINHSIGFEFMFMISACVLTVIVLLGQFDTKKNDSGLATWIGTGLFVMFMVVGPTIAIISLHHAGNDEDMRTSDNAVQIEAAANFLVHGTNPYATTYFNTPLATLYHGEIAPGVQNPALFHLISLPGDLLLTTAAHVAVVAAIGWFDVRMLYLALYFIAAAIAYRLGTDPVTKLRSVILVCCNPLLVTFMVEGRSDIVPLVFLVGAFLALHHRRMTRAAALFALACGMKAFSWVLIPVFLVVFIGRTYGASWKERIRTCLVPIVVFVGIAAAMYMPFLVWNAHAFIDSVIRYANGSALVSYPVSGDGMSFLLLKQGVIHSSSDYFPFWIFQAVVLVSLLVMFIPRLIKQPKVSLALFVGALMLFGNQYVARYFNVNHLGFILSLVAAGFGFAALEKDEQRSATTSHSS